MNFSRILSIYTLAAVIFCTPISAMQEQQTQSHNIFARSLNKVTSTLDKATDLFIKYALIKPAQMWFESQPVSEQERIVLESENGSIAHKSFNLLHSEEKYQELLKQKQHSLVYKNNPKKVNSIAILFFIVSPYILQAANQFQMLPANFTPGNSLCKTNPLLGNHALLSDPYDQNCYVVTHPHHSQDGTFIGCNTLHNYQVTCSLIDPINRVIISNTVFLSGTPRETYKIEISPPKIYKIINFREEIVAMPQEIFDISQEEFHYQDQWINKEKNLFVEAYPGSLMKIRRSAIKLEQETTPYIHHIVKSITQIYKEETTPLLYASHNFNSHESLNAAYNHGFDTIKINFDVFKHFEFFIGLLAHELGHRAQMPNNLLMILNNRKKIIEDHSNIAEEQNLYDLNNLSLEDAAKYNLERGADLLGALSLFVATGSPRIMSLVGAYFIYDPAHNKLLNYETDSFYIKPEQSYVKAETNRIIDSHPDPKNRIAYCLEVTELLEDVQANLLKSYELTMTNRHHQTSSSQ